MPHPCKSTFWGNGAELLFDWCDFLDSVSSESPLPTAAQTMSEPTWAALVSVLQQLEFATQCAPSNISPWWGGGSWDPRTEADLRDLCDSFVALLVADRWDTEQSNPHSTPAMAGWICTPHPPNPDPGPIAILTGVSIPAGGMLPPGTSVTPGSLIGRIKSALGS
jgi:hypothetical protein